MGSNGVGLSSGERVGVSGERVTVTFRKSNVAGKASSSMIVPQGGAPQVMFVGLKPH